jgi:uncharacterized delta-60 repeat protein
MHTLSPTTANKFVVTAPLASPRDRSIAIIDPAVPNYAHLVAGITAETDVYVLDADQDAIAQISQILAARQEISSLHIVTHGSPNTLHFSNTYLSSATLDRYTAKLQSWATALTDNADILLYGCNVAADLAEQSPVTRSKSSNFLVRLAELTRANIAASKNLTGSAVLGGDWELEVTIGKVHSDLAFRAETLASYPDVLDDDDDDDNDDDGRVSFGTGSTSVSSSVVVDLSGKIVVGGYAFIGGSVTSDFTLVRYNADRTLDTTFGVQGKIIVDLGGDDKSNAVAIDATGRIFVAGYTMISGKTSFALTCYKADGTLDTSFGTSGKLLADFGSSSDVGYSLKVDAQGRVLLVGTTLINGKRDIAVVRYTSTGQLDSSFGTTGKVTTDLGDDDEGKSITIDANGKILVAGTTIVNGQRDFTVVRYDASGNLDTSFGTGGKFTTDLGGDDDARSLTIELSGKILIGGTININGSNDTAIVRLTPDGKLDTSFGVSGKLIRDYGGNDEINGIALDASGKLVLAGVVGSTAGNNLGLVGYSNATTTKRCGCDVNGDGTADVIWFGGGIAKVWLMDGFQVKNTVDLPKPQGRWQISGLADFNGDGKADAIYRHGRNGRVRIVLTDGENEIGTLNLPKLKGRMRIGAVADFNDDGKADLICRDNRSGKTQLWQMDDEGEVIKINLPRAKGKQWSIEGTGDFNGDGQSDILWFDSRVGKARIWYLDDTRVSSSAVLPIMGREWQVKGVGDINGDNTTDIVFQNEETGAGQVWLLNANGYKAVDLPTSGYQVQNAIDLNGDGQAEVLWRDAETGASGAWYMKSTLQTSLSVSNWQEIKLSASISSQFQSTPGTR